MLQQKLPGYPRATVRRYHIDYKLALRGRSSGEAVADESAQIGQNMGLRRRSAGSICQSLPTTVQTHNQ